MLHRLITAAFAVLASLALASVALAGGWAQVTVADPPADPPAGGGTPIELSVLQHGVTPVSWPSLTVVATDATSGTVVRTEAEPEGPTGTYVATVVFPTAGEWTLSFESDELEMAGSVAVNVAPPVAVAPPTSAAPAAAALDPISLVVVVIAALSALGIAGLAFRSRRALGDAGVSVRT